jgi:hypothetical protein
MIGDGSGVIAQTIDDGFYRLTVDENNLLQFRRYVLQPPILAQQDLSYGVVSASRLCSTQGGDEVIAQPSPDWSRVDVNQGALRLAAWMRGNDRLAELFERPEEFTSTSDGRVLRLRVSDEIA